MISNPASLLIQEVNYTKNWLNFLEEKSNKEDCNLTV